jgi:hypothetical protein
MNVSKTVTETWSEGWAAAMMMTRNARQASNGSTAAVKAHVLSQNAPTWVDTVEAHVQVMTSPRCPVGARCPPANAPKNPVLNGNAVSGPPSMQRVPTIKPAVQSVNGATMVNVPGPLRNAVTNVQRLTSFVGDCVKAAMYPTGVSDLTCVANVRKRTVKTMNFAASPAIASMPAGNVMGAVPVVMVAMKSIAKSQNHVLI